MSRDELLAIGREIRAEMAKANAALGEVVSALAKETAHDAYLRLREDWQSLVTNPDEPMRSAHKDTLFARLARAWTRMTPNERKVAATHCCMVYH